MLKRSSTITRIIIASVVGFLLLISLFFIFKKKKRHRPGVIPVLSATFQKRHFQPGTLLYSKSFDLENSKEKCITAEKSVSGIRSCKLSLSTEYGFPIINKLKEIPSFKTLKEIQVDFKCWMRSDASKAQYIISIEDGDGKNIASLSQSIICSKSFEWNTLHYSFNIDEKLLDPENTIRIYPWNKGLREFFIDDITVSYIGKNNDNSTSEINPNYFFDFETPVPEIPKTENIKEGVAHSGKMSVDLSGSEEYGPIITKQFGEVCSTVPKQIGISIWVYPLTDNPTAEIAVSLFNSKNENYFWKGKSVEKQLLPKDTWTKISAIIVVPQQAITLDDVIQIIPRNKGRTSLLFDDLEIVYEDEPQQGQHSSEINSTLINKEEFSPKRNTPPFRTLFFQKEEIGNGNSTFINDQRSESANNFSPNDEYITGNFLSDENDIDELINIKSSGASLYSFCTDKSSFNIQWKSTKEINTDDCKIVGDFDNNGTDELLLINKKESKGKLISYTGNSRCNANGIQMTVIWEAVGNLFENWNINENDVYMSGDFNGDKKTDLLIVNSQTGKWSMFQYTDKDWKSLSSNKIDERFFNEKNSAHIIGKFDRSNNHDIILISLNNSGPQEYIQLDYNAGKKQFDQKNILKENTTEVLFKDHNFTFAGNFDVDQDEEILNLNSEWRFDLKMLKMDENGLYINSTIDFKGYPEDHNPKYYEFVKLVPGNFKTKNTTSVLVIMGNCADKNFNGVHCTQLENLSALPGSTQLYSIKH